MKEINFVHELCKLPGEIEIKSITEKANCLFDIFQQHEYVKMQRMQNKYKVITKDYRIATFVVEYKGIEMEINVEMPFTFSYNGNLKLVIPVVDINEACIGVPVFTDKSMYELFMNKIPMGGGSAGDGSFLYHSRCGLCCEGFPMKISHVELRCRIFRYFEYLTAVIDNMLDEKYDKYVDEAKDHKCIYSGEYDEEDYDYENLYGY